MKVKYFFCALFVFFLFVNIASQISGTSLQGLGENIEKTQDAINQLTNDELRADYLKQEWTKILNNTWAGPYLNSIDKGLTFSSPFFEFVLGIPYSLSWMFFLTIAIFLLLCLYAYRILNFFEPFYMKYGKKIKEIAFVIFVFLLIAIKPLSIITLGFLSGGVVPNRIPSIISFIIINFISGKGDWWAQLISVIVVFVVILVLGAYSKMIESVFFALKEKRRVLLLEQEAEEQQILQKVQAQKMAILKRRIKELERLVKSSDGKNKDSVSELEQSKALLISLGKELMKH